MKLIITKTLFKNKNKKKRSTAVYLAMIVLKK